MTHLTMVWKIQMVRLKALLSLQASIYRPTPPLLVLKFGSKPKPQHLFVLEMRLQLGFIHFLPQFIILPVHLVCPLGLPRMLIGMESMALLIGLLAMGLRGSVVLISECLTPLLTVLAFFQAL